MGLAIGLQPDPDDVVDWSDQFFQDLQDLTHFVRTGRADWELIYAFLLCRGVVRDGDVPNDRRFRATLELRNSSDIYLGEPVGDIRELEDIGFFERPLLHV